VHAIHPNLKKKKKKRIAAGVSFNGRGVVGWMGAALTMAPSELSKAAMRPGVLILSIPVIWH
jgi:hypothetical protein